MAQMIHIRIKWNEHAECGVRPRTGARAFAHLGRWPLLPKGAKGIATEMCERLGCFASPGMAGRRGDQPGSVTVRIWGAASFWRRAARPTISACARHMGAASEREKAYSPSGIENSTVAALARGER